MLRRSRFFALGLAPVLVIIGSWLFEQVFGSAASEALTSALAAALGVTPAKVALVVLGLGLALLLLWAVYELGVRDRADFEPRPDTNAADAFLGVLRRSRFAKTARGAGLLEHAARYESHLSDDDKYEQRLAVRLDREMHDLLRQGRLMSWGKATPNSPEEPIKPEQWADIELWFDRASLESKPPVSCAYYRRPSGSSRIAYSQIRLCRDQIEQRFPSAYFPRRHRRLVGTRALEDAHI